MGCVSVSYCIEDYDTVGTVMVQYCVYSTVYGSRVVYTAPIVMRGS